MAPNRPAGVDDGMLVMLLAGGQGERLHPLTKRRAKPAVPFAGCYRLIDFTLANCLNSGLRRIYLLTQHQSLSLDRHVRIAWDVLHPSLGEFIQSVPPQRELVSRWYAGTADAVFQNLHLLDDERPRRVVVLSGDHVYRMDYRPLLAFHRERGADLTVACTLSPAEATRMGVVEVGAEARIEAFIEKPPYPVPLPGRPDRVLVNMGVYVFETEALVRALIRDAKAASTHDFGGNIVPKIVEGGASTPSTSASACRPTSVSGATSAPSTRTTRRRWPFCRWRRPSTSATPAGRCEPTPAAIRRP